jgi:antibiotic biosynthesis monooxygenase (ABM) superfamily enzyme
MNPSSTDSPGPKLEVRGTGASAVIVQRVPADKAERFMALQEGIVQAAQGFPGYQKVDIYPPANRQHMEWVVVIHFDDAEALQRWLDAPVRAEWIAKFQSEIGESHLKKLPAGFGAWFTGVIDDGRLPPHWKIALTVLFGLYPTVMLLTLFLSPHTQHFGLAVSLLISNVASVSILEWLGTPALNPLFGPWLRATGKEGRTFSLVGLVLILVAFGVMTFLFSLVKG